MDRFLFLSCRPFPNHTICKINVLLYSSYFFYLWYYLFYFVVVSLVYPLPILKVAKKSGRGQIRGFYGTGGCTMWNTLNFTLKYCYKLILKISCDYIFNLFFVFRFFRIFCKSFPIYPYENESLKISA